MEQEIKYKEVKSDEDLAAVSAMWTLLMRELGYSNPDTAMFVRKTLSRLQNESDYAIVLAENGAPVGFLEGLIYKSAADGKIHGVAQNLYIRKSYRNKGIDNELIYKISTILKHAVSELVTTPDMVPYWNRRGFRIKSVCMEEGQ